MRKGPWTPLLAGLMLVFLGFNSGVFAASHRGSAFVRVEMALAKGITALSHEPDMSNTGLSGSPNKGTLDLAFAVQTAIPAQKANVLVHAYLKNARSFDSQYGQFIKPYKFEVYVYLGNLDGQLILVGIKHPGTTRIMWHMKA